jgi:hypothetical protein
MALHGFLPLEIIVDDEGNITRAMDDVPIDRSRVRPIGRPRLLRAADNAEMTGNDVFFNFRQELYELTPKNANAYDIQRAHPSIGAGYYDLDNDGNVQIPVQFYYVSPEGQGSAQTGSS